MNDKVYLTEEGFLEIEEELIFEKIITPNKTALKKNSKKKQFNYRRYEVDGYTILCGKNNKSPPPRTTQPKQNVIYNNPSTKTRKFMKYTKLKELGKENF